MENKFNWRTIFYAHSGGFSSKRIFGALGLTTCLGILIASFITGKNIPDFEEKFAKKYGKENSRRIELIKQGVPPEEAETHEYKAAQHKYNNQGLDYVNYYPRRIKDSKGRTQTLHTKFEIERDTDGKFIGYRFIDARFLPEFGPESPFEKLKAYTKR